MGNTYYVLTPCREWSRGSATLSRTMAQPVGTQPVGTAASENFLPTYHPRSTGWFPGDSLDDTAGSGGMTEGGAPRAKVWGLHRVHPPDRIGGPTARVPPPQAATYAGKGPERVREGGRRRASRPRRLQPISSRERGARQPTRGR
eukprot:659722-Pleurochrysis_carterae.AAC.1